MITKKIPFRGIKMYNIESISEKLIENVTDLLDELGIEDYEDYREGIDKDGIS
jgi:hypothetical protein